MNKETLSKYISIAAVLLVSLVFVAIFGGPAVLKAYIATGIGDCQRIPILCMTPEDRIITPEINKDYAAGLLPYRFPKVGICVPRGFNVVQEEIKKAYYKKAKHKDSGAVVYALREEPDFFINLFPHLVKQGITDNFAFLRRTMYANLIQVKSITDAFFVVMKSIFTPDVGDQLKVKIIQFKLSGKRGFINYNLGKIDNYFDCNIIADSGDFFKLYIRDRGAKLNLDKVLAIIWTMNKT